MEWHHRNKHPPFLAPPRRSNGDGKQAGLAGVSFSASLLDAIYRSLDGNDNVADINGSYSPRRKEEANATPQFWWASETAKPRLEAAPATKRRHELDVVRPRHSGYASSSTSSVSSSSYSFSCSSSSTTDSEPLRRWRHLPLPPQPVAVHAVAATPLHGNAKKKRGPCLPGAMLCELRNLKGWSTTAPPSSLSPASFARLLKSLFTSVRLPRKPKSPAAAPPPVASASLPSCISTSRTKASVVPETVERRSVRFCADVEAAAVRRRVEELVRRLREVEEEDGGEGSDASSDLFELVSLRGPDEHDLPVYGTTSLAANRGIAQERQSVNIDNFKNK